MKTFRIIMMATCLFIAGQSFASGASGSMKEQTESWLQASDEPTLRGNRIEGETPEADPIVPVYDSLLVWVLLSGAYIVYRKKRSSQQA